MPVQELSKFTLPPNFRGRSALTVQLWWFIQATLFAWSPQFAYGFRAKLLRFFGAKVGKNTVIRPTVTVTYPWKVSIGDYAWIGDDVVLYSLGEIEIGDNAVVSQRSYLCTGGHDFTKPAFDIFEKKIVIEPEAWVATDVFVAPGVCIGKGCIVGARSSVFKDMPPMMICYGNPAKPMQPRVMS
jgi:putative colanic acid biosynthesis acetyltransferase WcaF